MERDFGLNLKAFKSDPQYESDVKKIKYFKSFWNKTVKSNAAIPLKHESQVIGSLDLEYSERKVFSKMDQDILEALAGLPEVALIKANLSKDLEELYARSPLESKTRREKRINEVLMHCQDIAKSKECLLVFYDNDKKPFSKFGDKNIKYKFIKKNIAPTDTQQHIIVHANGKDYLLIKILENIIEFFINLTDINKSQSVYLFINKIMPDLLNIREFELHEENIENTKKCFSRYGIIVGDNPQMQYVLRQVTAAVKSKNTTVFIEGESGTGKELIANVIHRLSKGRKTYRTYAAINCAALPEQLLESELFGTKEGAFTGAVSRSGYFETIRNGTILLDEITEMTIASQAKLLRALQTGEFYRLGSTKKMKIKDTRIIASTNKNLEEEVAKEKFRSDLFYRLNAIKIRVPSLRERREHILELSEKFLKKYGEDLDKPKEGFSDEATRYLYSYSWPGNIRELDNSIARAVINEVGPIIHVNYLLSDVVSATSVDFEPSRKSIKLKYPHMVGLEERDIFKLEDDEIEKINSFCGFLDQDTQPTKENIEKYLKISKSAFYILRRKYNLPYPKKRNDLTF